MEKYFKVSESELRELLTGYNHWLALMSSGVDNWTGCSEAEADFIQAALKELNIDSEDLEPQTKRGFIWFEDLAEIYLKDYQEVE